MNLPLQLVLKEQIAVGCRRLAIMSEQQALMWSPGAYRL